MIVNATYLSQKSKKRIFETMKFYPIVPKVEQNFSLAKRKCALQLIGTKLKETTCHVCFGIEPPKNRYGPLCLILEIDWFEINCSVQ